MAGFTDDILSDEQKERALQLTIEGMAAQKIVEMLGVSQWAFWQARRIDAVFAREYALLKKEAQHSATDKLVDILEYYPNVNDARLMSDNIKWRAAKILPEVYGDRMELNVNETVSIRGALEEGRQRALRDVTPRSLPTERSATGLPPVAGFLGAERSAPNAGSDALPVCVKTALAGPTTRRDGQAATLAAPSPTERVTGHRSAKNESVSHADIDISLDPEIAPVNPLS